MGAVISRRRGRQAKAHSISTQATEWSIGESLTAECKEAESTDAALCTATRTVRALRIGDGLTSSQTTCPRKSRVKKCTNNENRKTKVLPKVKFKYRWLHKKQKPRGTDCSTQYDHVALAKEVAPSGQSPNAYQCALEEGNGTLNITLCGGEPTACEFDQTATATDQRASRETKSTSEDLSQGEMIPVKEQMTGNQGEQVTIIGEYSTGAEDENSNILERSRIDISDRACFLPVLLNSDLPVQETLPSVDIRSDERNSNAEHSKVVNRGECQPVAEGSPPLVLEQSSGQGDTSTSVSLQIAEDCKPAPQFHISYLIDLNSNPSYEDHSAHATTQATASVFKKSELASDSRSPFIGEHITNDGGRDSEIEGQMASRGHVLTKPNEYLQQTTPSEERADFMKASTVTGTGDPLEQIQPLPPDNYACWDETPLEYEREDLSLENGSHTGDGISEDTLDWNVDDRVRSPSDSRSGGTAPSDGDENNIDNLNDCTTVGIATSVCQLQTTLCNLKKGDSLCKISSDNLPQDLETEKALDAEKQNQTRNDEHSIFPTTLTTSGTKNSEEGIDEMEANKYTLQSQSYVGIQNETKSNSHHENTVENRQNDSTPNDLEKRSIDETGRILVGLAGENMSPDHDMKATKSVAEKQEVEAITLLLFTGLLPDEPNSGVIRGAGDAQNLETMTERERSDVALDSETAGLACMTNSLSKTSCQLEQLQTDGIPVQNLTEGNNALPIDIHPPSTEQVSSNNSSAAGIQATDQHEDSIPNNFAQADSSEPDNTPTDLPVSFFGMMHGAAAASLVEERVEPSLPSPQRNISPGAASSESEWEVIPLHRVLGQTNLGGLPACPLLAPSQIVSELDGPSEDSQFVPELQTTVSTQPLASKSQASATIGSMTESMDVGYVPQEGREWNFFNATPCEEQDAHSPLHLMNADTVPEAKEEKTEVPSTGTSVPRVIE